MPNGITLSPGGVLGGTPMPGTGGVYTLTITASNGASTGTQTFTLTINQAPAITSGNNVDLHGWQRRELCRAGYRIPFRQFERERCVAEWSELQCRNPNA